MTPEERDLISGLFDRLKQADHPQKDEEAAALIEKSVRDAPSAPYLLVQCVLVQDHALNGAQARIAELERSLAEAKKAPTDAAAQGSQKPSFLGGMLGRGPWGARPDAGQTSPSDGVHAVPQSAPPRPVAAAPTSGPSPGTGFLQSALTTATGVVAGSLLYDGIRSLFSHGTGPFSSPFGTAWAQGPGTAGGAFQNTGAANYFDSDLNQSNQNILPPDDASNVSDANDGMNQTSDYQDAQPADFDTSDSGDLGGGSDFGGDTDFS